jgi:mono/diheme cytochrome c family protein
MRNWVARRWAAAPLAVLTIAGNAGAWQLKPTADHNGLVKQYCVSCHNNKARTGSLSLEGLDLGKLSGETAVWEKVLRKVNAKEMPPAGMPKPPAPALHGFTKHLEAELDRVAAARPNPGRPTIHRLNRAEYSNAIRDLLALDVKPGANLPADDTGYGFDNIADVLSLSPMLVERYVSVARSVAKLAVGNPDVKPVIDTFDALREVRTGAKGQRAGRNDRLSEDLPFGSVGGLSFRYTFPVDGEYVFRIRMARPNSGFGETAPPVGQVFEHRVPVQAGVRHVGLTFMRSDALPEVIPGAGRGFGGGRGTGAPPPTAHLDLRVDGARLKLYDVPEGQRGREIVDLSIAGPFNVTGPGNSASRERVFACRPPSPREEEPCARRILSTLGRRAFRRPVTPADVDPLMRFYREGRAEGSFDLGIEAALRALLVSPHFLFRVERDPAGAAAGSAYRIGDLELASRLSFFLWSSIPDEELLGVAEKAQLKDPAVLAKQVDRMLDDPKSTAFVSNFAGQWLLLRNMEQIKPDVEVFTEFDESLRRAFRQESEHFFNAILRENRPVTDLVAADFTYVNQRLAEFYGIPNVWGSRFRRVEFADGKRGGLLGQGSILTVTSYPTRTSVVLRGKWVLENLLGSPPPAPPPDVPALELKAKDRQLSGREALELHRTNPVCASCHSRMDPIGFALENYNGIGGWRDKESGAAIDASGKLPDGAEFHGPAGLKKLLTTQFRDDFVQTFTEKLMIYALGRGLESYDQPGLRRIVREASRRNSTIAALIHEIVKSPQFQMRRTREL